MIPSLFAMALLYLPSRNKHFGLRCRPRARAILAIPVLAAQMNIFYTPEILPSEPNCFVALVGLGADSTNSRGCTDVRASVFLSIGRKRICQLKLGAGGWGERLKPAVYEMR